MNTTIMIRIYGKDDLEDFELAFEEVSKKIRDGFIGGHDDGQHEDGTYYGYEFEIKDIEEVS